MGEQKDATKRQFRCELCNGLITIPVDLPPTKGPCPHCGQAIVSPALPRDTPETPALASIAPLPPPEKSAPRPAPEPLPAEPPAPEPPAPAASHPIPPAPAKRTAPPAKEVPPIPPVPEKAPLRSDETPRENEPAKADPPLVPEGGSSSVIPDPVEPPDGRKRSMIIPVALAVLLLAVALLAALFVARDYLGNAQAHAYVADEEREMEIRRARYLRVGWKDDAQEVLREFIAASTIEEKAALSIGGEALSDEMTRFYGSEPIDDSDTAAEDFSAFELRLEDRERGLFLMIYDRPPQFELGEFFRPLATLEVQHKVEPPDMLLASFARAGNFVMEPVRVQAFFKKTGEEMKVDWHVFTQTKHRLMRSFLCSPEPGRSAVFRVLVGEDVPEAGREESGTRTYRVSDPVYRNDSARVRVAVDSEIGRLLSKVNWRGSEEGKREMRTATLELAWQGEDDPEIVINRMLCWEFLGLGGEPLAEQGGGS